ncbi:hypothetical protein FGW37_00545 [Streptomyces rectiverticillatus]|uniref:hypothetical protein n=1 Tax=Streptomyces rectiverticillatus TaxID=173860 RepID=UPI0015C35B79|nr:hypothetical protein [Streptomyces rectiverticillatus]QLE70300.1 hypothetical protein FGW37_00545 [Streptomyces rectiverticillatus]
MVDGWTVDTLSTPVADVWIASSDGEDLDYSYGGTRKVHFGASDDEAERELGRLVHYESRLKNRLINRVLADGALDHLSDRLPPGFLPSRVGGGRCLFRPRDAQVDAILSDPAHPDFEPVIEVLFAGIGRVLNEREGRIKLTPDFGRFSGVSDILYRFTPHVLGIRREDGGCGGKASYTTTGIVTALEHMGIAECKDRPVTVIGSAGALGAGIANHLAHDEFRDLKVADLVYSEGTVTMPGRSGTVTAEVLPSEVGRFTDACLGRGGVIVPATYGGELAASDLGAIPRGTMLVLAHNLALPSGTEGRGLAAELQRLGIDALPGQILTLGGALTSRIEWFSRAAGVSLFDKPLAHAVVRATVTHLMEAMRAEGRFATPYERMLDYAGFEPDRKDRDD